MASSGVLTQINWDLNASGIIKERPNRVLKFKVRILNS